MQRILPEQVWLHIRYVNNNKAGSDHGGGSGGYGGTLPTEEEEVGEGTADVGDGEGGGKR